MNIVIATVKSWNLTNFQKLKKIPGFNWILIKDRENLTYKFLKELNPKYIFFPHWSWVIPEEIYKNFKCVVFHMTDLPFGRGGSPLQNLISRGIYKTRISAIEVVKELDAGDIYLKRDMDLSNGSAEDIFREVSKKVYDMIIEIVIKNPALKRQVGKVVEFKRRTPSESEIPHNADLTKVYDWIRMLDAEGYPPAFIKYGDKVIEFRSAKFSDGHVDACVQIRMGDSDEKNISDSSSS